MTAKSKPAVRSRKRAKPDKIDITAVLTKPVKVGRNGQEQKMTPFEVSLRAQVKKAVKERRVHAIKNLLEIALQYGLIEDPPPPPPDGGVLIVPGRLTMESWAELFEKREDQGNGKE
jgi:hypothetical protein